MKYKVVHGFPKPEDESAWRDCLAHSEDSSHYTSPEFFLEPWFRDKHAFAVLAYRDSQVDGVLTGILASRTADCGLAVRPQVSRRQGSDLGSVTESLAAGLLSLPSGDCELMTVFSWEPLPAFEHAGFTSSAHADEVILLDLTLGPDALFAQCSDTRRSKIRRAKREGVTVRPYCADTDFDGYITLYEEWCAFKGLPAQPREFQREALASTNRHVLVARHHGSVVGASIFRFQQGGLIEYAANVSRREESKIRQNDLLMWSGIEWACQEGFRRLSLGGAHFYLQSFGGTMVPTYSYRLDRTLFRKHDLKDSLRTGLSSAFQKLPQHLQTQIRRVIRRT